MSFLKSFKMYKSFFLLPKFLEFFTFLLVCNKFSFILDTYGCHSKLLLTSIR